MKRRALIAALPFLLAATDPASETEHVVAAGETLNGIANRAGVPAAVIAGSRVVPVWSIRISSKVSPWLPVVPSVRTVDPLRLTPLGLIPPKARSPGTLMPICRPLPRSKFWVSSSPAYIARTESPSCSSSKAGSAVAEPENK